MVGGGGSGATVAFESIDGPPPQVFDRMVGVLDSESKLRNLSVVSREGQAGYHLRTYLAAQVSRGRTTISWVWDVYDANQQRTLRLSGDEPTAKSGRDAWAPLTTWCCGRSHRPASAASPPWSMEQRPPTMHRPPRLPARWAAWSGDCRRRAGRPGSAPMDLASATAAADDAEPARER